MRIAPVVLLAACSSQPVSPPDDGVSPSPRCTDVQVVTGSWNLSGNQVTGGAVPDGCYRLEGSLTVTGAVTSLAPLGDLRGVTDLVIDNTMLKSIDTPEALHVPGSIVVNHNDVLVDLGNVEVALDDTLTGLQIKFNDALADIGALAHLTMVTGQVEIGNNDALETIDLRALDRAEGGLDIHDNDVLVEIDLQRLASVTMDFRIANNPSWTRLAAMQLSFVHGNLVIDNNDAIVAIDAFQPLMAIDGNVQITGNASLTSIGLLAHAHIGGQLQVVGNPSLSYDTHHLGWCTAANGCTVTY